MEPVVTVCLGHRCAALAPDALGELRQAVRCSRSSVLVSTGCLGACAQAPVVVLSEGLDDGPLRRLRASRWLGPVGAEQVRQLCGWVRDGAAGGLAPPLEAAVFTPVRR